MATTYRILLIDLDGVIRHWQNWDEAIERKHGLPVGLLKQVAFSSEFLFPAITGRITDDEWRVAVSEKLITTLGYKHGQVAVREWSDQAVVIDHKIVKLLKNCANILPSILITNATSRLESDLKNLDIEDVFQSVVNSSKVGCAKPAREIYEYALQQAGVSASEALYVDDTPKNVEAARIMGIRSHHFVGREQMTEFLVTAGIPLDMSGN